MKIGVISDTHLSLFEQISPRIIKAFSDVDLIVHTGDFIELPVLEGLRRICDVKAVCGNMDSAEIKQILPEKDLAMINGKKIGIIHGWGGPLGIERRIRGQFDQVEVILFGHSHEARNLIIDNTLFFNPGMAVRSFGLLEIDEDIQGRIIEI